MTLIKKQVVLKSLKILSFIYFMLFQYAYLYKINIL